MDKTQLDELNKSTVSSYARKAAGQANKAGGIAKALDRKTAQKEGEYYKNSNVPDPKLSYGGEAKSYADLAKKRFAGVKAAKARGADVNPGNMESVEQEDSGSQLNELSTSTLSSYARKAAGQANKAGGIAKALDRKTSDKEGERYKNSNVPDPKANYTGEAKPYADLAKRRFAGVKAARAKGGDVNPGNMESVIPLFSAILEGNVSEIKAAFEDAIALRIEEAIENAKIAISEELSQVNEAGFRDVSNMSSRQIQKMGHNDNNDTPSRPASKAPAASSSGKKVLRQVRYAADYDENAEKEHMVHINGKPWKSFGTKAHATNVANKIKGATVHPKA